MPGIGAACPAECFFPASFQIEIAEPVIIQKGTSAAVLSETLVFPVDFIFQTAADEPPGFSVSLQRGGINLDLPSRTAGIWTGSARAAESFIIMWECIMHV